MFLVSKNRLAEKRIGCLRTGPVQSKNQSSGAHRHSVSMHTVSLAAVLKMPTMANIGGEQRAQGARVAQDACCSLSGVAEKAR